MTKEKKNRLALTAVLAVLVAVVIIGVVMATRPAPEPTHPEETAAATSEASTAALSPTPTVQAAQQDCPSVDEVNREDAQALIEGFLKISYCWDSTKDPNTTTAILRAQELLTPEYAQTLNPDARNSMNAEFALAAKENAHTIPDVSFAPGDAEEINTDKQVGKEAIVSWVWAGDNGSSLPGGTAYVSVGAVRDEKGIWSISGMQVNDMYSDTLPLTSDSSASSKG